MEIFGYNFTDPKMISAADGIARAAVYVVMTHDGSFWSYLYVGQTGDLAQRFDQHEKWNCWLRNRKSGGLFVAILLDSDKNRRLRIETDLRNKLPGLPCNKQ
jgi:predicted GIY-YIG superfamily endonuclease